jgi:dipeptidyl aminopeptidase/acylaminoacyl peptidase
MTDLSIADVLDVEYPSAPEWSANGRFIAAPVYEDDGHALVVADTPTPDASAADASAAAENAWRVSPGEGHVTGFEWGPDSRPADLVIATDEGETYRADPGERSVRLVSESPDGESHHEWSPDGRRLSFYRDGRVCVRDADSGVERLLGLPIHDTFLPSERMLAWSESNDRLAFSFTDRETWQVGVADAETGDLVWRTDGTAACSNPAWLADGRLAFERIADNRTVREFVAVDPDSGERAELVREEDDRGVVSWGAPTVSPDRTRLAVFLPLDGWDHLYVVDAESGERRQLTSGEFEDKGVAGSAPQWADDRTLLFASNRRDLGQRHVFAADAETGEVTPAVTSEGTNVHPRPSPDGDRLAYVHAEAGLSPEVRVAALDEASDEGPARLTESAVAEWPADPISPERVRFESFDGREIEGYLLDPRETDAVEDGASDLPAVVWVHGGPMRQMRDGWHPSRSYGLAYAFHQYLARRGYVGLVVNYRGGIGYGKEFRQALFDGYGRDEMEDVVAGADYLRDLSFTSEKVGIWGLSYGGYATLQILGTHPEAFDVGVNLAGLADVQLYEDWASETKFPLVASSQSIVFGGNPWEADDEWAAASPKTHFDQYEAPLYNFHGTGDAYVNFEQLDVVVEGMLEHGNEYEADYYPDENHVFSKRSVWRRTFRKIEDAFDEHLR